MEQCENIYIVYMKKYTKRSNKLTSKNKKRLYKQSVEYSLKNGGGGIFNGVNGGNGEDYGECAICWQPMYKNNSIVLHNYVSRNPQTGIEIEIPHRYHKTCTKAMLNNPNFDSNINQDPPLRKDPNFLSCPYCQTPINKEELLEKMGTDVIEIVKEKFSELIDYIKENPGDAAAHFAGGIYIIFMVGCLYLLRDYKLVPLSSNIGGDEPTSLSFIEPNIIKELRETYVFIPNKYIPTCIKNYEKLEPEKKGVLDNYGPFTILYTTNKSKSLSTSSKGKHRVSAKSKGKKPKREVSAKSKGKRIRSSSAPLLKNKTYI
jgi:hypothetical protein